MQRILLVLTLFITTFWSLSFTKASPIEDDVPSQIPIALDNILIGWNGIRRRVDMDRFQRQPYASAGGELGAVLYIADGTDLARFFARGEEGAGYVCQVFTVARPWSQVTKHWVSQRNITDFHNNMHNLYPGSVLFASHTAAGLGQHEDRSPWQMGIRGIQFLGVTARCFPAANAIVAPHQKINYATRFDWGIIGTPERGP
ncbi:hypothetical protein BYT27DRAFT_7193556 [Phlegmacium glaucopus]|nr:hypothetical protein BYT27DRAFT_7193556 [Phlegmacium glaucopus]